jgi:hypothetical protein
MALATAIDPRATAATLTRLNAFRNPKLRNSSADQPTTTNRSSFGTGLANCRLISRVV